MMDSRSRMDSTSSPSVEATNPSGQSDRELLASEAGVRAADIVWSGPGPRSGSIPS
jgi:hypothetical protein